MTPLISVVIPSYNHRNFIGEAIASVRAQTYQPIEIVVIDDGSTDGSFEYFQRDFGSALAHLGQRDNAGAHATINDAITQAGGEWIAILNSDDIYAPDRIARLFEFASRQNHDLVFSDVSFCDERGPLGHAHKAVQSHARATASAERSSIEHSLLNGNFVLTTSNLMMRRTTFDAVGPVPSIPLLSRLGLSVARNRPRRLGWLREPLLSYRLHGANTIREPDHWRHIAERGLVYAAFLGNSSDAATSAIVELRLCSGVPRIRARRGQLAAGRMPPAWLCRDLAGA